MRSKYSLSIATVPCGPSCSRDRREAADVREEHGRDRLRAAEDLLAGVGREQPVGEVGIHVAGERRADALLVRDVLDHHHRAEVRRRRSPSSGRTVTFADTVSSPTTQLGVHRPSSVPSVSADALPCARAARRSRRRTAPRTTCRPRRPPRAGGSGAPAALHVCARPSLVERDHAVRHALEHRLVVVPHRLDVGEQLRVLEAARDLGRERPQAALVLGRERPAALVQRLRDADRLARLVEDRARRGSSA